jgi:NADP+-dependent farnesol dehydrogenase
MTSMFQELSKSLKSEKGKLHALKCDVSKEPDIQAAFKWVKSNLGGVDILVNNAATMIDAPLSSKYP